MSVPKCPNLHLVSK